MRMDIRKKEMNVELVLFYGGNCGGLYTPAGSPAACPVACNLGRCLQLVIHMS
jgi:hypothetical protein